MSSSSRAKLASALVVPLAALGLIGASLSPSSATRPSVEPPPRTDTLFPQQGHTEYDVRHYDVRLGYRPQTNHLDATTRIRAVAKLRLTSFRLDLVGMRVHAVRVNGETATWSRTATSLVVTPRKPVKGAFSTTVSYRGTPSEYTDTDGSTEGWVRTADGAIGLGEPLGTMTWIPSNNTPADKARYTFRVTVPDTVKAVANGNLVSKVDHGRRTTWTWDARDQMSTYLATVAIGAFTTYRTSTRSITGRTIPIWSFVDPTTDSTAPARRMLPKVLRFEERLFGPYPFTSAGMLVDDADVGYALETQTRPFFPFSVDGPTLVHEMAHQWYGNSVTLRDWHDIWLAEGFATYAEWLWDGAHGGRTPAQHFDRLYATPAGNGLWRPAPTEFTDSADLFGEPSYNRGAMTLQALRERIGSTDFLVFLQQWAKAHRQGNASTRQLVALAERISGEQLDGLFADWLELEGKPAGY